MDDVDTRPIDLVEKIHAVEFDGVTEYREEPSSRKSSTLGERLSKDTRTQLVQICLKGLRREQDEAMRLDRGRGRPRGVDALLAEAVGVTTRTVQFWVGENLWRACDLNADALAEIAYRYCPEETAELLRRARALRAWLVGRWRQRGVRVYVHLPLYLRLLTLLHQSK